MGSIFDWFSVKKHEALTGGIRFSFRARVITLWIAVLVTLTFLILVRNVLPTFIWACLMAYLFYPIVSFFSEKTRIPRLGWIIVLYLLLGLLIFWGLKTAIPIFNNELAELAAGSPYRVDTFLGRIASQGTVSFLGIEINMAELVQRFSDWIREQAPLHGPEILFGALERLIHLAVFWIVTFYLLLDAEKFVRGAVNLVPEPYRREVVHLGSKINATLGAYVRGLFVLILIMSVATFIALSILQVKYALLLSILTGILEVFPIVGPIVAAGLATIVAMFQETAPFGLTNAGLVLIVIIVYFVLRQLEDYFVIPNVVGKFVHVYPVVGLFALLVGGYLWGILGFFLALPVAAVVKVIFTYFYGKLVEE